MLCQAESNLSKINQSDRFPRSIEEKTTCVLFMVIFFRNRLIWTLDIWGKKVKLFFPLNFFLFSLSLSIPHFLVSCSFSNNNPVPIEITVNSSFLVISFFFYVRFVCQALSATETSSLPLLFSFLHFFFIFKWEPVLKFLSLPSFSILIGQYSTA